VACFALTLVLASLAVSRGAVALEVDSTLTERSFGITHGDDTYSLDYWSNGEVGRPDPMVTNVVVVVHGDSRNADDYARYTVRAAAGAGRLGSTLVVAPRFVTELDLPRPDQLYWTRDSWKEGGPSEPSAASWSISSFDVMDRLLATIRQALPAAKIVVTGHSAGGQFVQRYAAAAQQTVVDRYVPMNPGSYLYFDRKRWTDGTRRRLTSAEKAACPGWNTYKYGVTGRTFLAGTSTLDLRTRYFTTPVTYVLGRADVVRDSELDVSCEADWEGANRYARGRNFFAAVSKLAGPELRQSLVTVPGVAHEGSKMIGSSAARPLLFP
jgi:pimeloyl-ACP methyl ester carboxylesterase